MEKEKTLGFIQLAKKSLAVIAATLSALMMNKSYALPQHVNFNDGDKNINYEKFQKKILKPKLVLRLNPSNPNNSIIAMHASHSSHSSHSSHASHMSYSPPPGHYSHSSHNSHASHYSSSPSYTPDAPTYTSPNNSTLTYYALGSRNLSEGCQGTDVKELQQLLINLGYSVSADGVFGTMTKSAVVKFQLANSLIADGIVGKATLTKLQAQ